MRKIFFLIFLFPIFTQAQVAYQHITDEKLYQFLDELASNRIIDLNTAIKPYSRSLIAKKLNEASHQGTLLNERQLKELQYYLKEFALENGQNSVNLKNLYTKGDSLQVGSLPPEINWKNKPFRFKIRPILGFRYFVSGDDKFYHSYGGLEATAYIGNNWGIYANLRDNYQNKYVLAQPSFFTQEMGGNYKLNEGGRQGGDFSEMRGGITYSWKWGSVGLIKDHLEWGDNVNGSNIFSGRTPSFAMVKLHMNPVKWLDFNYFHGWLVSEVIDSSKSYITSNGDFRAVYHDKYIAANMFTITPFRNLNLSFGNSIIYSDIGIQAAYFIPFLFFKSVDHTLSHSIQNQNSQMFFAISSRNIKHLHFYSSLFIDEFSVKRISESGKYNFTSLKAGFTLSNWPIKNIVFTTEFTRTMPITYKHYIPSTTFETNKFNLGHYLRDNSQDIFMGITVKPYRTLQLNLSYCYAFHGNEYPYLSVPGIDAYPVLDQKTWSSGILKFRVDYRPIQNTQVFIEFVNSDIKGYDVDGKTAQYYLNKFSAEYLHGQKNIIALGFAYGFQ